MRRYVVRIMCAGLIALGFAACGAPVSEDGGGSGTGGGGVTISPGPATEVAPNSTYADLANRMPPATVSVQLRHAVLLGQTPESGANSTITFSNGTVTGGRLDGTDIDDATYTNPANGEFSRIVRITGDNLFGVVGLDMVTSLPPAGTVTQYREGWVGLTAAVDSDDAVYVLEGDAVFTVTWGSGVLDGSFINLSGTNPMDETVTNVGRINLNGANISGDTFSGGYVTGLGIFADLDCTSCASSTRGAFFGPEADELGGVLVIDDASQNILVLGAFQAD